MAVELRKLVVTRETVLAEMGRDLPRPVTRAVGMAVIRNPFAGQLAEDLSLLFAVGRELGEQIMAELVPLLRHPPESYGKGALVGTAGEMEHGGACIHPMLGKPMRAALGGGQAIIPSNVKLAAPGTSLDLPLGHKDNVWSFDHFDTVTVAIADAPRPDEIVVVMGIADGGRPWPRCGSGPVR